jgi:large subunit ribosomal protein L5e
LADEFKGNNKVDGSYYSVAETHEGDKRPFKAYLDVGLVRTTTGNRVFGAMKGACDGGLNIPHESKRFPGFRMEKAEIQTDKRGKKIEEKSKPKEVFTVEEHREHIFGIHVQEYYDKLMEEDKAAFERQFSRWSKALKGKSFEDVYTAVHKAIKANPDRPAAKKDRKTTRTVVTQAPNLVLKNSLAKSKNKGTWIREKKLSKDARRQRVQTKIAAIRTAVFEQ